MWGVRVILYPVRCIARSGRPKKRLMLRIIGLCMFARAVCPPYVRSWFWLGTSNAQTHLIRHSNYLQPYPASDNTCRSIIHNSTTTFAKLCLQRPEKLNTKENHFPYTFLHWPCSGMLLRMSCDYYVTARPCPTSSGLC